MSRSADPTLLSSLRRSAQRPRRGFTLLELLVVIGLITLLTTITVVGFKKIGGSTQAAQTKSIMERLRNMSAVATREKAASEKFLQVQLPYLYTDPVSTKVLEAVDATTASGLPGTVDDASLYRTGKVIALLSQNAEAKGIFDEIPAERKKLYFFDKATLKIVSASNGTSTESLTLPLDAWGKPILFVADNLQQSASTGVSSRRKTSEGYEVGGLTFLLSSAKKYCWQTVPAVMTSDANYVSPPLPAAAKYTVPAGYTLADRALRSPDRTSFWASGGADQNLVTYDDNLYSFSN